MTPYQPLLRFQGTLMGSDIESIRMAEEPGHQLVDSFYQVEENLSPHQHRTAKNDFDYFMRLLDLAINYWATGEQIR